MGRSSTGRVVDDRCEFARECAYTSRGVSRRQGVGSRLFAAIYTTTADEGRSLLTWSTFDAVPASEAFSIGHDARVGRISRTSEVAIADIDWPMVAEWSKAPRANQHGYTIEFVDGVFPIALLADAAMFHHIMQTAPRDDLDVGEVIVGPDFIAELDQHLAASGRTRWTIFVRDADGNCAGGTEVTFDSYDPRVVHQQNTGIDPAHRGIGLAKWAKAAMLERVKLELASVSRITTGNAFSNAAMLAINDELGFVVTSVRTEWQLRVASMSDESD